LIACVNTGQFMLAQSLDRETEVAVRASLGASRGRLFRQFLVESSVPACAGGALGLLQALWLVQALVALVPGHRPERGTIGIDRLAAITGVEAAATAFPLPFRNPPGAEFTIEGRPTDPTGSVRQLASYQIVSPDYFRVFRIPLREGRVFSADDVQDRPRVAIVSERLWRRHWPAESAVGHRIRAGGTAMTIVGVVGDVQATPLETARGQQIYVSNL